MSKFLKVTQVAALIVSVATTSCGGESSPESASPTVTLAPAPGGDRVLFVGNSLTEGNDLPLMVEALAREGRRPFAVEAVTYGGAALEDHWSRGTQDRIAASGFRFVVLQQGPSALAESRTNLREWTRRFDAVIRENGGRTALYMVWPESYRPQAFPDVSASYRLAAEDVKGIVLPAGDAWVAAWREEPGLRLYGPDGFHPTVLGSYLAALAIYGGLTGASPVGLPPRLQLRNGRRVEVTAREAAIAQAAAAETLAGARGALSPPPSPVQRVLALVRSVPFRE
ncbi:MAG TPA: SGNH/GDSL hydrolase family protein [Vicinamibacteria bacterium]|nr:SGNH/GDSL hydrolase family protein [Vicinamibacteria bacterium]